MFTKKSLEKMIEAKLILLLLFAFFGVNNIYAANSNFIITSGKLFGAYSAQTDVATAQSSTHGIAKQQNCISKPIKGLPTSAPYFLDCTGVSWVETFKEINKKFSKEYAYTEWRGINWSELQNKFVPKIAEAEKNKDEAKYYQTLREYLESLHDGHVTIMPAVMDPDNFDKGVVVDKFSANFVANIRNRAIGGGYGLVITKIDGGKFVVSYTSAGGSAAKNGMAVGDEVIAWNTTPIWQAIQNTPITWTSGALGEFSSYNPATLAGTEYEKIRLLTRAELPPSRTNGDHAAITVFRPSTGKFISAVLEAQDDNFETMNLTKLYPDINPDDHIVTYKILPSNYGYLKVTAETNGKYDFVADVKKAIELFVTSHVPGVIIDMRGNQGGDDDLAASLAGFFYNGPPFLSTERPTGNIIK